MKRKIRYLVGDFETTVYEGQEYTEVWSSAIAEFWKEEVIIHHSISETYEYLINSNENIIIYYHNLKFDGHFWLYFLENSTNLKQALEKVGCEGEYEFQRNKDMPKNSYKYMISDMGQWYSITIKTKTNKIIEIRDSLKLLPFSVKEIGNAFETKHKKLEMEYKGYRYAGCKITEEEKKYIANDVLVVKEALEIMFTEGHKKLTIGSCCLEEFKSEFQSNKVYDSIFPNLYEYGIDEEIFGVKSAGEFIRKSYRGGWCYLVKGKERKLFRNGVTLDVNSLYPSVMHSDSGCYYPYGLPTFWNGNYIPSEAKEKYYFIKFRTKFYIKKNHLPFVQIKGTWLYKSTESLETSDILNPKDGKYYDRYIGLDGEVHEAKVELTMTCTDYELFLEHYNVKDFEVIGGCYFEKQIGIFDQYIDKYKKIKLESTGAKRSLAKLFLNNLYGKMATNTNNSFKVCRLNEENILEFAPIFDNTKIPGYIAIGSAITSYARNFTIRTAQKNYYGANKRGFIYADTDSIHCNLSLEEIKGVTLHDKNFCCWKAESFWDEGWFVRQKTYIEHITHEDTKPIEKSYYNIRCAGLPERGKQLFINSMIENKTEDDMSESEKEFVLTKRKITDFDYGIKIPGKLLPKRIMGGVVLTDCEFEMR
ncbi:MAG: hypothetical protein J6V44_09585 [Methanobrevibacter sp.]|nr:hypothetical protein [Methanobrevibacter sp.]